jgi:hypothetical protein
MSAHKGNQYNLALKTPEIRQKAYKLFCEHLANGYSVKSWWYEDNEGNACTWETMISYLQKFPDEFSPIQKKIAETKGYMFWENTVKDSATGKNKDASTASLQMVMRNKYGWDKDESKQANTSYTIKIDKDGLATGISTKTLSTSDTESSE